MSLKHFIPSLIAAATITTASAFAASDMPADKEKCKVVKNGEGLILAGKADCKTESGSHTCATHNKDNDADSWILVPKGQCEKINAGDLSGVDDATKAKLKVDKLTPAKK